MGFHNVTFPGKFLGDGTTHGPAHETYMGEEEADSGIAARRVSRYAQQRRAFRVSQEALTKADASELVEFIHARQGAAHSFLVRDPMDFSTNQTDPTAAPTAEDINWTDNTSSPQTYVQFFKDYDGPRGRRYLHHIEAGSVLLEQNGSALTEGTDFVVDLFLGRAYILSPVASATYTGGCKFDVKARFGTEVDELLQLTAEDFDSWSTEFSIIEDNVPQVVNSQDRDRVHVRDEITHAGGGHNMVTGTPNTQPVTVSWDMGRVVSIEPGADIDCRLPPELNVTTGENLPSGGPYFVIANRSSTYSLTLKRSLPNATYVTLASRATVRPGKSREIWLDDTGQWRAA